MKKDLDFEWICLKSVQHGNALLTLCSSPVFLLDIRLFEHDMICFIFFAVLFFSFAEETKQVLRLSLTEFSLPKFYLLFGISKVKSAAVIAFRSSYRDRSFSPGSYERETFALSSLETVTEALLEIMEVSNLRCILWMWAIQRQFFTAAVILMYL